MKSRAFCIDRVLVFCANRFSKIFYKVIASKAKPKQYFEAAKDLLCQPGRADLTGKAFQRFLGECFFVLLRKQFLTFFPQCFGKRILCLVACKNSGSVMILNGFFFTNSNASDSNLYSFLSVRKLKFLEANCDLGFSQVVFSICTRRVEISVLNKRFLLFFVFFRNNYCLVNSVLVSFSLVSVILHVIVTLSC